MQTISKRLIIFLASLLVSQSGLAEEWQSHSGIARIAENLAPPSLMGSESHGGDFGRLRDLSQADKGQVIRNVKRRFQFRGYKKDLVRFVQTIKPEQLKTKMVQRAYSRMLANGLLGDIISSEYVLSDRCIDSQGIRRFATSDLYNSGGEICIDVSQLEHIDVHVGIIHQEIAGILMHEHAHHFGIKDKDMQLARDVTEVMLNENMDYLYFARIKLEEYVMQNHIKVKSILVAKNPDYPNLTVGNVTCIPTSSRLSYTGTCIASGDLGQAGSQTKYYINVGEAQPGSGSAEKVIEAGILTLQP